MATSSADACDAWFGDLSEFAKPICIKLREIIHRTAPDLEEVKRWSVPCYKGTGLVCAIGGFKDHVNLMFMRGAELEDPRGVFQEDLGNASSRTLRFKSLADIQPKLVQEMIQKAVELDASPVPKPKAKRVEIPAPEVLQKALAKNKTARQFFEALPPSQRREYSEWIAGAKQEETVQRRLEKTMTKLSAGEGLNDKYRKK